MCYTSGMEALLIIICIVLVACNMAMPREHRKNMYPRLYDLPEYKKRK